MGLAEQLLGGWHLESFRTVEAATGAVSTPLGEDPRGFLLYTADGHMSAQLARADGGGYLAYGGRFRVEEHPDPHAATVHHDVMMATVPQLLAAPQVRHAHLDGDRLTLSATTPGDDGVTRRATLTWRR